MARYRPVTIFDFQGPIHCWGPPEGSGCGWEGRIEDVFGLGPKRGRPVEWHRKWIEGVWRWELFAVLDFTCPACGRRTDYRTILKQPEGRSPFEDVPAA